MQAGLQTLLVVLLAAAAAGFLVRGSLRSARAKGCASGCGACASRTCALRRLEEQLKSGR